MMARNRKKTCWQLSVIISLSALVCFVTLAGEGVSKEDKWWQKRAVGQEIHYPHNIHMEAMNKEGDSCLLCHSFNQNSRVDEKQLAALETIANEPLKAICHDCHLDDLRAPWRCDLCHLNPKTIWPNDHDFNYLTRHGEDARHDEKSCRTCHVAISFCTDCHFRRGRVGENHHELGYQSRHGIDARMMPSNCGRCHSGLFCSDCHRRKK